MDPIRDSRFTILNKDGSAGGREKPVTSAPAICSIVHSQAPLKPVCPVTKTRLFL